MRSTVDEVGRDDPREAVPAVANMRDGQVGPVNPRRRGQYQYYQPAQPMQRGFW